MDLEEITNNLQNLINEINNGVEETTKELGKESLRYMKKQYIENGLSKHTGNLTLHAYNTRYKKGFVISPGDDIVAIFNEFGTGIRGENSGDLADIYGYKYNVSSRKKGTIPKGAKKMWGEEYCESVTTPDTWWYFKNGKWWWSRGAEGKNMFAELAYELNDLAPRKYSALISGLTAKYGRK